MTTLSPAPSPASAPVPPLSMRPVGRLAAYGVLTAFAFIAYGLGRLLDGSDGVEPLLSTALSMAGAGACGWAWLIARALFDPAPKDAGWPRGVVLIVVVSGALSVIAASVPALSGGIGQVIDNTYALAGSAALLLTFVEPLNGYRQGLSNAEKRFRLAFVIVYSALVAVSILAPGASQMSPEEARRIEMLKAACALAGLVAGAAAIAFRLKHPLAASDRPPRRAPTTDDQRLADRIRRLLDHEDIHAEPNLKVADLAARLGEPEYRVSQCVSAVMGFDNFNRMINHHRIERAKRMLVEPGRRRPILDIAFDCGFGSVGPFNRAFKAETGMTPRAWRTAQQP